MDNFHDFHEIESPMEQQWQIRRGTKKKDRLSRWKMDVICLSSRPSGSILGWLSSTRLHHRFLCTCGLVTRLSLYTLVTCCSNLRAPAPMKYIQPLHPPVNAATLPAHEPGLPAFNQINFTRLCTQSDTSTKKFLSTICGHRFRPEVRSSIPV